MCTPFLLARCGQDQHVTLHHARALAHACCHTRRVSTTLFVFSSERREHARYIEAWNFGATPALAAVVARKPSTSPFVVLKSQLVSFSLHSRVVSRTRVQTHHTIPTDSIHYITSKSSFCYFDGTSSSHLGSVRLANLPMAGASASPGREASAPWAVATRRREAWDWHQGPAFHRKQERAMWPCAFLSTACRFKIRGLDPNLLDPSLLAMVLHLPTPPFSSWPRDSDASGAAAGRRVGKSCSRARLPNAFGSRHPSPTKKISRVRRFSFWRYAFAFTRTVHVPLGRLISEAAA